MWANNSSLSAAVMRSASATVDFLVHREDAHAHFWPLTKWKFISPVSYWDANHYGNIVGLIEIGIAAAMIAVLWRRFKSNWVRLGLGLAIISYVALPMCLLAMPHHYGAEAPSHQVETPKAG